MGTTLSSEKLFGNSELTWIQNITSQISTYNVENVPLKRWDLLGNLLLCAF